MKAIRDKEENGRKARNNKWEAWKSGSYRRIWERQGKRGVA